MGVVALTSIPDHSLLTWKINLASCFAEGVESENLQSNPAFDSIKFDVNTVTPDFLSNSEDLHKVNAVISKSEASLRTQRDVDSAVCDWCSIVEDKMYSELPYKSILSGISNRKRKIRKPWWSNELTKI